LALALLQASVSFSKERAIKSEEVDIKVNVTHVVQITDRRRQMRNRPTSITVIAWFLILSLGFSLLVVTAMINNAMVRESMSKSPIPIPVHYAIMYISALLTLSSDVAMLKQHLFRPKANEYFSNPEPTSDAQGL
jgi:hypothetical protein